MTARSWTRTLVAASVAATLLLAVGTAAALPPPVGPDDLAPPLVPPDDVGRVSIGDGWGYEADGSIEFLLTLDEPADLGDTVAVGFTHVDTDNGDFVDNGFNVSFGPGTTEATLEVDLIQLDGTEPPEHFELYLVDPDGLEIEDGVGDGTIYDADGPTIDLHDAATAAEGDPGEAAHLDFEVELSYAVPEELQLRFASTEVPGEAEAGSDYEPVDEIMHWAPGATSAVYEVPIVEDLVTEQPLEAVSVWIADASVGTIQDDTAAGRIEDDDLAVLSVDDVTEVEGTGGLTDVTFTVSLDQPAPYDIDVDAAFVSGTAVAPADWQDPGTSTLTFSAGETTKEVVVDVVGDATVEPDEDLTLVLDGEQMAEVGDGVGLGTILDDDGQPGGTDGQGGGRTGLPFTGASTGRLASVAALLLGLGGLLVVWHRRREATA
jgi:hypothetical protein